MAAELKTFATLAVASAATGIGLCEGMTFSDMMEIGSHVLGFPIWTHELGTGPITEQIHARLMAQFPKLPSQEAALADWKGAAAEAVAAYGDTLMVAEGNGRRTESPINSLARLTGRPDDIIVVVGK